MLNNAKIFQRLYPKYLEGKEVLSSQAFFALLGLQREAWRNIDFTNKWLKENETGWGPHLKEEAITENFYLKILGGRHDGKFLRIENFYVKYSKDGVISEISMRLIGFNGRIFAYDKSVQKRRNPENLKPYPLAQFQTNSYGKKFVLIKR